MRFPAQQVSTAQAHLIPHFLAQPFRLVQGEACYQLSGQHMRTAQLIHNLRHVKEGVALQQLPVWRRSSHPVWTLLSPQTDSPPGEDVAIHP